MCKTFRIWQGFSDGGDGDRSQIALAKAYNMDNVITMVKNDILKNEVDFYEDGSFSHLYLILNSCKNCDLKKTDLSLCDDCEYTEFIEIEEDNDLDLTDQDYYDLTIPDNPFLNNILYSVDEALNEFTLSRIKEMKK